jgi:Tol biopolymer transport system component
MFRVFRAALLFLFVVPPMICAANSRGQMRGVAVSPDGKILAITYLKDGTVRIYKIVMDTGNATRLTDAKTGEESSPAFSSDGKSIAYSYVPEGQHQRIMVMNVDGSNSHSLPGSDTANVYATFAPNGKKIYFGRSQPPPADHLWDIFAVGVDGGDVTQVTHEGFLQISEPSLSSDGRSMVVATQGLYTPQRIEIYLLDHPEKPSQVLYPRVPNEASPGRIFGYPNYMPDGKSILFLAASNKKLHYDYDVYRVEIGTGAVERLTEGNGFASDLKVFNEGKMAVFLKWRSDWHGTPVKSELYLLDVQTHKLTPLKVNGLN